MVKTLYEAVRTSSGEDVNLEKFRNKVCISNVLNSSNILLVAKDKSGRYYVAEANVKSPGCRRYKFSGQRVYVGTPGNMTPATQVDFYKILFTGEFKVEFSHGGQRIELNPLSRAVFLKSPGKPVSRMSLQDCIEL
jgi:hypothetical protein